MTNQNTPGLKVWPGRHVTLELKYQDGEIEQMELDVVPDKAADFARGFLGESTPLAKAIIGRQAGEPVSYRAGDIVGVRILAVNGELSAEPEDLSARREETLRKAIRRSDDTSEMIYASAMSNKWGDYDPSVLNDDENDASSDEDAPSAENKQNPA